MLIPVENRKPSFAHVNLKLLGSGLVLASKPEHGGCREGDGGQEDLRAPVVSRYHPPPVHEPPEHDLDAVATFVAALFMPDGFVARLPAGDAGVYPLVFQSFPEPISILAAISRQPLRLWQFAQPGR